MTVANDLELSRDSASIEINRLLGQGQTKGAAHPRVNKLETPNSHMMVPDERSNKLHNQHDESFRMKAANKELDELLGLDFSPEPNFVRKIGPSEAHHLGNPIFVADERVGSNKLDSYEASKPKMINRIPSDQVSNGQYLSLVEENKRLKASLDAYHNNPSNGPKGENPALKVIMLQDQLTAAKKTIEELTKQNEDLAGTNEVLLHDLDALETDENLSDPDRSDCLEEGK